MTTTSILAEAQRYLRMVPAVLDGAVTITLAQGPDANLTQVRAHSRLDSYGDRSALISTPSTAQELVALAARTVDVQLAHACMWEDDALTVETVPGTSEETGEDITDAWYWLADVTPEEAVSVRITASPSGGIEGVYLVEPGSEDGERIRLRTYDRLPNLLRERQDDWEADQAEA